MAEDPVNKGMKGSSQSPTMGIDSPPKEALLALALRVEEEDPPPRLSEVEGGINGLTPQINIQNIQTLDTDTLMDNLLAGTSGFADAWDSIQ